MALIVPIEHLGASAIETMSLADGSPGLTVEFSGRSEMFWCTRLIPSIVKTVGLAIARRGLDRIILTQGMSTPAFRSTPMFTPFGGIETYYHNDLLPKNSLMSEPWSMGAAFWEDGGECGEVEAADVGAWRCVSCGGWRGQEAGYQQYRNRRATGGRVR